MRSVNVVDSLPTNLHNWLNGLESLSLREIEESERAWQARLVGEYANEFANDAWGWWLSAKAEEIAYLEAD